MPFIKKLLKSIQKIFSSLDSPKSRSKRSSHERRLKSTQSISPRKNLSKKILSLSKSKSTRTTKKLSKTRKVIKLKPSQKPATSVSKKLSTAPTPKASAKERQIGEITHYFPKIGVVVIKTSKGPIQVGDKIRITGKNTDFVQYVNSLQIESVDVKMAGKGKLVGLKTIKLAQAGDKVSAILGLR